MSKSLEELKNEAIVDCEYEDFTDNCTYACSEKTAFIDGWDSAIKATREIEKESTWDRERIDAGHEQVVFELKAEITNLKEENEKLKKSREGLRKQLSIFSKLEISTNVSYDTNIGKKAREALKADDEIMGEGK